MTTERDDAGQVVHVITPDGRRVRTDIEVLKPSEPPFANMTPDELEARFGHLDTMETAETPDPEKPARN